MAVPTRANDQSEVLAEMDEFGFDATPGVSNSDTKLGDLAEGGLRVAINVNEIEVKSGSQREIYAYVRGSVSQMWSGELLNVNGNNLAFALGENEDTTNFSGTGTVGDPYILSVDPELFGEQVERIYYGLGTRVDGDIVRMEADGRVFAPNVEWTMAQGEATVIPFSIRINGSWDFRHWTP